MEAREAMKANGRQLSYTDLLAVPLMGILAFLLQMWVPPPLAVASSVFLVLFTSFLFGPRPVSYKRAILFILLTTLATYMVAALLVKITGRPYLT